MSNKIPCGGFYLDDMLNVNDNGELSINGGTPYQQLVTDGEGGVKWEDRLAYDNSKVVVYMPNGAKFIRVSDEIPSWASAGASVKVVINSGVDYTIVLGGATDEILECSEFAIFIKADGADLTFPKKGVYFAYGKDESGGLVYISSVSSADSEASEITWDGNIGVIKTIDSKYIPSELNEIILPSSTSGSSKKFKITVDDSGAISATEVT